MTASSLRTVCLGPLSGFVFCPDRLLQARAERHFVSNVYCGFVDAGYLHAQGSRACGIPGEQAQLRASACVDWLQAIVPSQVVGVAGLRLLARLLVRRSAGAPAC